MECWVRTGMYVIGMRAGPVLRFNTSHVSVTCRMVIGMYVCVVLCSLFLKSIFDYTYARCTKPKKIEKGYRWWRRKRQWDISGTTNYSERSIMLSEKSTTVLQNVADGTTQFFQFAKYSPALQWEQLQWWCGAKNCIGFQWLPSILLYTQ